VIDAAVRASIEEALGVRIAKLRPTSGGSIAEAFVATFVSGATAFVKTHPTLPAIAMQREAEGLEWLASARAVRIPKVLAVGRETTPFLVLELVDVGRGGDADEEAFGRELAALHRTGAPRFGHDVDNFLAILPQENAASPSWASFYRDRRLAPLALLARAKGLIGASLSRRLDQVCDKLEALVGPEEPPARLHGDLWGGNRVVDRAGRSWLVDPAVYGGHREIDLAMMRLFGGFGARAFSAYADAFPLAPGAAERVLLNQLYPILAHVVMFGAGYVSQLETALARYR